VISRLVRVQLAWLARARHVLATALVAGIAVATASLLALHDVAASVTVANATLWLVVAIAGLLATARLIGAEHADAGLRGILLAPADRRDVFLAHAIAASLLALIPTLSTLLVLVALFPATGLVDPRVAGILLVGVLGTAPAGTLAGFASLSTRAGETVTIALAVPAAAPLLVSGLHATQAILTGAGAWKPSIIFATGYAIAVGAITYLVAKPVTEVPQ
jgi:ABC-type transport system involved in cytochrome c biogenesis permease component